MQTQDWPWLLIGLIGSIGCGFILPIFVIYYGEMFRVSTSISVNNTNYKWSTYVCQKKRICFLLYEGGGKQINK